MNMPLIANCPGTLAEGFDTYSPACLRRMFEGKRVSHILPYDSPKTGDTAAEVFWENRRRISISGVQEKVSMVLEKNQLRLTHVGEAGTYILKPIPKDVKRPDMVPANEHLTMQIARQVYDIQTADNALIFFPDGQPAYLTKRFDAKPDGKRRGKEDFATLSGRTSDSAGPDFKYRSSYEEAGLLLRRYVPAWRLEVEKYFSLVVFNYLFSNGDAHLKNFSLLETAGGDYVLSPAYDLLNTHLHVDDSAFALEKGSLRSSRQRRVAASVDLGVGGHSTCRRDAVVQSHRGQRRIVARTQHHTVAAELRVLADLPARALDGG